MNFGLLTQKSLHLFAAVGGWRTVAEVIASRVVYLVAFLVTGDVGTSALIAVGAVLVFAVVRVCTDRKWWQAAGGLLMVGICASLASGTGQSVAFYLPSVLLPAGAGVVFLVSLLVRRPVIGLVLGASRDDRRYQLCTVVFLAKFVINVAVLVPLYVSGQVVALGVASTLFGMPALAACGYLCWRILRTEREQACLS
jgi:uncharacterized membrane protein